MNNLFPLRPLLANLPHWTHPVGVASDEALEVHARLALWALVGAAAALARSRDAVVLLRMRREELLFALLFILVLGAAAALFFSAKFLMEQLTIVYSFPANSVVVVFVFVVVVVVVVAAAAAAATATAVIAATCSFASHLASVRVRAVVPLRTVAVGANLAEVHALALACGKEGT